MRLSYFNNQDEQKHYFEFLTKSLKFTEDIGVLRQSSIKWINNSSYTTSMKKLEM